ncbi:MAG: ABC transporter ATP-binding protein [Proteobacteria bacterium]|nr:ABC transporter ATP-binding protein [Pseudomonadota bacterium]
MALLELSGVSKRFGAVAALTNINLDVELGEVHCLLGENGAGKSTLCNLIFGVHRPTAGTITFGGAPFAPEGPADALRQGIGMVHQHFSLVGTMTVVENLMMGRTSAILDAGQVVARMKRLADEYKLEVDPWRVVRDLSVGERQQVEIIKCLLGDPKLLVLDEPTAVLPPSEVDAFLTVCRRVADDGRGVILVTHKLAEIAKVADRTTVLRQGTVIETVPMEGADMRALVRSMIGHEIQTGGDGVLAATLGLADAPAAGTAQPAQRPAAGARGGKPALELKGVSFRDAAGVTRLDDVTLQVRPGEVVGIAGVEGNGQSELGAILAGLERASAGSIVVDGTDLTAASPKEITATGVGIVPEDRHAVAVVSELSIAENMFLGATRRFSRFGLLDRAAMKKEATALMREFDVRASNADAPMSSLSGGNQQKAVLARELTLSPLKLLLAAQPTRGLDVSAVEAVYSRIQAARDKGLGVLLISSELNELIAVSDRVAVIYRGRIVGEMEATASNREAIGSMMSGHA